MVRGVKIIIESKDQPTPSLIAQNVSGNNNGGYIPPVQNAVSKETPVLTKETVVSNTNNTNNNNKIGSKDNINQTESSAKEIASVKNPIGPSNVVADETQTPRRKTMPKHSPPPITQSELASLIEGVTAWPDDYTGNSDKVHYYPNVLSDLYNYTYHFKFYVTSEEDLVLTAKERPTLPELNTILDGLHKVVIAESGVTAGFNIKEVEIENLLGPTFENRNAGEIKNFKMTIVEPLGSSLMETMLSAAIALDIQNFSKMWYFLELNFMGYDQNGNPIHNPVDKMKLKNNGKWIYKVAITNMEVHMDEGGSTYNLSMIPYNMSAFDEGQCGCVPDNINVSGGTIKEFCDDLAAKMTKAWEDRYLGQIYKFNFKIHPIEGITQHPNNYVVIPSPDDPIDGLGLSSDAPQDNKGSGKNAGMINKGVHVADIIGYLYAHCDEAQKLILDVNTPGVLEDNKDTTASSASATYNGKKYRVPIVPIIEPEVIITGFDQITGNYMKEITYHVYGYRNFTTNISPDQDSNVNDDPKVSYDMVKDMMARGFLKKKYEHRFTGLNTEVLRFDLDYNFSYSAILPKFVGWNSDVRAVSTGEKFSPNKDQINNSLDAAYNELKTKEANLTVAQESKLLYAATEMLDQNQKILDSNKNDTSVTDTQRADAAGNVKKAKEIISRLKPKVEKTRADLYIQHKNRRDQINKNPQKIVFGEDIQPDSNPFKITYTQQNNESVQSTGTGLVGPWHRGASLVGALFNQLHSPMVNALTKINLDIRGDPYWIGRSNLEKTVFHYQDDSIPVTPDFSLPNSTLGDTAIALIFRFPSKIDPDTGVPVIRRDDMFTGIYRVINVKNTFADGQFKQSLEAIKVDLARMPPKEKQNDNTSTDISKNDNNASTLEEIVKKDKG